MTLFNPTRDQARQLFFDTWAKFKQQQMLTDLEKIALHVIQMHPEYHDVLNTPEQYRQREYFPLMGETNPFLHMSLHLSILEQMTIDQPVGIKHLYTELCSKQHAHDAQHVILDCLAETIWYAQQNKLALDSERYLNLIKQTLKS